MYQYQLHYHQLTISVAVLCKSVVVLRRPILDYQRPKTMTVFFPLRNNTFLVVVINYYDVVIYHYSQFMS